MKFSLLALAAAAAAYDVTLGFSSNPLVENRTLDEIYEAALREGNTVTLWHGGDEKNQQDDLKTAFEARFPGLTLNVTVDLSKYHDIHLDQQLARGKVDVDVIALQTVQDFPRWRDEGALLFYAPVGFDKVYPALRDSQAAWYAIVSFFWSLVWNEDKLPKGTVAPTEFPDLLRPEFKDKLVLTYPNDDDAVLHAFDLILQQYGEQWFDALLTQNPRWVRGTATPATLIATANASESAVTFTSSLGLVAPQAPLGSALPKEGQFVSWGQSAGILRDAPHPEGAKLLVNFLLSEEHQNATGMFPIRSDVASPAGYPGLFDVPATNPSAFPRFMEDRARVERLRFYFEDRIGAASAVSPLEDDL